MTLFFSALIVVILIHCALIVAPALILLRLQLRKLAALASVLITASLYYDHERNWDDISYPHWLFGGFDEFFPLTFGASILMLVFVIRAILKSRASG